MRLFVLLAAAPLAALLCALLTYYNSTSQPYISTEIVCYFSHYDVGGVCVFSLQASPPRLVLLLWLVVTRPSCWCPWMCPHRRLHCSTWLVRMGGGGALIYVHSGNVK
mgnify:CR=1 FL=1